MTFLTFAEIDLNAVAHNVKSLRGITLHGSRLMAVVKANAYGHGAAEVARTALKNGAELLGVARIEEGIQLREAGLTAPVLIFGYTLPSLGDTLTEYDLMPTVSSYQNAQALSSAIRKSGTRLKIHLKIDTGMGRIGMIPDFSRSDLPEYRASDIVREIESVLRLPGLETEGIYTHFATADSRDKTFARKQFERFSDILNLLRRDGAEIPIRHAANSAGIIDMPETHLDMVRAGISLYGLYPSDEVDKSRISLIPAMSLKSKVAHLKNVPAGFSISYGCIYQTDKPAVIATVPVGYGDGYDRLLSSKGCMLVRGHRARIVGRVCMDMTMLDVGHIPDVRLEDEVVVLGKQGKESVTADAIASSLNTINYEVVTRIMPRAARVFV